MLEIVDSGSQTGSQGKDAIYHITYLLMVYHNHKLVHNTDFCIVTNDNCWSTCKFDIGTPRVLCILPPIANWYVDVLKLTSVSNLIKN